MSLTDQYRKDFQKIFASFGRSGHTLWQVWEDFLTLASGELCGCFDQYGRYDDPKLSEFKIALDRYTEEELQKIDHMFDCMVQSFQRKADQDFLGDIFMQLGISDKWKGQYFTPYSLAKPMAMINLQKSLDTVQDRGWCKVYDPTCGAGVTLLAVRNGLNAKGVGTDRALFIGQDISATACKMCHIQLSLMGCAGYVVCADTLVNPLMLDADGISPKVQDGQTVRYTPAWYDEVWQGRAAVRYMDAVYKAQRTRAAGAANG